MKRFAVVALIVLLSGCDRGPYAGPKALETESLGKIAGLEGCTYTKVDQQYRFLHVVRCPNSVTSTTVQSGKSSTTTITR